jgi:hypothetical protein
MCRSQIRGVGGRSAQIGGEPGQNGRLEQEIPDLRFLAIQYLACQVGGDQLVGAIEVPYEVMWVVGLLDRQRSQLESGCPTVGPLDEHTHFGRVDVDPCDCSDEVRSLRLGEREVDSPQFAQPLIHSQSVEVQIEVPA